MPRENQFYPLSSPVSNPRPARNNAPMCYDLFGEIPVTEDEIVQWVAAVAPRWLTPQRSFDGYVRGYDVPGKIREAKRRGVFNQIVEQRRDAWHARLALAAII